MGPMGEESVSGDSEAGGGEDIDETDAVELIEGGEVVRIKIKDRPALAIGIKAGHDDLGSITGIAGDVFLTELRDIGHDDDGGSGE